jgi:hypothetical protein
VSRLRGDAVEPRTDTRGELNDGRSGGPAAAGAGTRAMERVKDLSWGLWFEALDEKAPTRIELVYEALQASA